MQVLRTSTSFCIPCWLSDSATKSLFLIIPDRNASHLDHEKEKRLGFIIHIRGFRLFLQFYRHGASIPGSSGWRSSATKNCNF